MEIGWLVALFQRRALPHFPRAGHDRESTSIGTIPVTTTRRAMTIQ